MFQEHGPAVNEIFVPFGATAGQSVRALFVPAKRDEEFALRPFSDHVFEFEILFEAPLGEVRGSRGHV